MSINNYAAKTGRVIKENEAVINVGDVIGDVYDPLNHIIKTTTSSGGVAYVTATHTVVTVANTTTLALAANANRRYALFINDSDETIYIKIGANAVLNQGIRINANGGSYEIKLSEGSLNLGAINAICTSGSKKLLVTEGV